MANDSPAGILTPCGPWGWDHITGSGLGFISVFSFRRLSQSSSNGCHRSSVVITVSLGLHITFFMYGLANPWLFGDGWEKDMLIPRCIGDYNYGVGVDIPDQLRSYSASDCSGATLHGQTAQTWLQTRLCASRPQRLQTRLCISRPHRLQARLCALTRHLVFCPR